MIGVIGLSAAVGAVGYLSKKKNKKTNENFNNTPSAKTSLLTHQSFTDVSKPKPNCLKSANGNKPITVEPGSAVKDKPEIFHNSDVAGTNLKSKRSSDSRSAIPSVASNKKSVLQ